MSTRLVLRRNTVIGAGGKGPNQGTPGERRGQKGPEDEQGGEGGKAVGAAVRGTKEAGGGGAGVELALGAGGDRLGSSRIGGIRRYWDIKIRRAAE